MTTKKETITTILFSILGLSSAFAAGFIIHGWFYPPELDLQILSEAQSALLEYAYDSQPEKPSLEYGMIHGMVQAYNEPYTIFVEPPQHELETDTLEGRFGGIGVTLGRDKDNYIVFYPFPDGPAFEAGILDGEPISNDTGFDIAQASIRGPEGEKVNIIIHRPPDYMTYEFSIRRKDLPIPSVAWHLADKEPRLCLIEVNIIGNSTQNEILNAVGDLRSQGATHFALDLRGNGGGYLEAGIEITRLFLTDGVIIEQQYRGEHIVLIKANKGGELADIPLVILVDHNTASAAEIIAGAIQNNDRAILIGSPTFGKNSIQIVVDLSDGSSLHVTAAKWWFPGMDFPINGKGLFPEIEAPSGPDNPNIVIELVIEYFFKQN